jgi:dipeptidase
LSSAAVLNLGRMFRFLVLFIVTITLSDCCTNLIVTPEASVDGSSIVAYNADSSTLYGMLYHYPASTHKAGDMKQIFDWDSGKYLGEIPEPEVTYNVVGNVNEYGLVIGETTYGGLSNLQSQSSAKIDYGSLIWTTLQRAKTAREAIKVLGELMSEYGYASEGESFSLADQNEAWIMEIIGKGEYELGAVFVAMRIPAGYVTAHANQARIRTFPLNDPDNCIYSPDVISFARNIGVYTGTDEDFSFSDVYDPLTFGGGRFCESRVWSFFSSIMGPDFQNEYLNYALGYNISNRMPLFVKPSTKISVTDVMKYMRSHYETMELTMEGNSFSDVGAITGIPYRAHGLTFMGSNGKQYLHERPIATPQTGWNFVAQSRKWMPRELSALLWFGVDDAATTVRFPIYGSASKIPEAFGGKGPQDGYTPPLMKFSFESAFYVFNLLSNFVVNRYDLIYDEVLSKINTIETDYINDIISIDEKASLLINTSEEDAIEYVTNYSVSTGNKLVKDWLEYFGELFVKYRDGYIITANNENKACGCNSVGQEYPQQWFDRIISDTGDHYFYGNPNEGQTKFTTQDKPSSVPKHVLLSKK